MAYYNGKKTNCVIRTISGKLTSFINGTITEITEADFGNATSIRQYTFADCNNLTSVTIGNSVTSIGERAFKGCSSLTNVTIPDSVTSIGAYAFYNCDNLTSVHITDIAKWCAISFGNTHSAPLYYADNLYLNGELVTELVIPDGVTSIVAQAFRGCSSFTSLTIPSSVTSIGMAAFNSCSNLTTVTVLATTPATLGSNVFGLNDNLAKIIVPSGCGDAYKTATNWAAYADIIEEAAE